VDVAAGTTKLSAFWQQFPAADLKAQIAEAEALLSGKYSSSLNIVADRFSHLRKLARPLLNKLTFTVADTGSQSMLDAMQLSLELINGTRRSIPADTKLDFLPKTMQKAVTEQDQINRRKYEAAVFTAIRDQVDCGNLAITGSKRFGKLDDLFIAPKQWEPLQDAFFRKTNLPRNAGDAAQYLTDRLRRALDYFLENEQTNAFTKVEKEKWVLSADAADSLTPEQKQQLEALTQWLAAHMRTIKLPDLLIEVDNDLHFTDRFLPAGRRQERIAEDICAVLTTLLAYGCNVGPHTMAEMRKSAADLRDGLSFFLPQLRTAVLDGGLRHRPRC
jgi:Tn3 transposase DDE domain